MFQPVIPSSGLAGWRFLQRTYDVQYDAFVKSSALQRDTEYFREKIGEIKTADDLVSDRRLLGVALGAFGLSDDLNNKFFVNKMLAEGTSNRDSLANKFVDKRYREFSKAFGFGPGEFPRTKLTSFASEIISKFERNSFEIAVGEQDQSLRVALGAEREFGKMAAQNGSPRQNWFTVMGKPAMRELFEMALNLPKSFSQIDIDQQQAVFADRTQSIFGTSDPAAFAEPKLQEKLLNRYTALSQLQNGLGKTSSSSIALSLLSGIS